MPLNFKEFSTIPESFKLPEKTAITAFILGAAFVITPIPQLIICSRSNILMLATAYISPVCGIIAMLTVLWKAGGRDFLTISKLDLKAVGYILCATLGIILCSGTVCMIWKICLDILEIPYKQEQYLLTLARNCSAIEAVMLSALVVLIVPVAEELLFRRILFAGLLQYGVKTAWFGTAIIFSICHLFLAGAPGLFIIGLGFQWLYFRYKNLTAAILAHGFLNGCAVLEALLSGGA